MLIEGEVSIVGESITGMRDETSITNGRERHGGVLDRGHFGTRRDDERGGRERTGGRHIHNGAVADVEITGDRAVAGEIEDAAGLLRGYGRGRRAGVESEGIGSRATEIEIGS